MFDVDLCFRLLRDWAAAAERWWYDLPGHPGLGCYGSGYNSWGVQTNQKYLGALAVLSTLDPSLDDESRERWRGRAVSALRFSFASHVSGELTCTDGDQWGHTWISALGVERMMHGVQLLEPSLTDDDRAALRLMLISEAEWLHAGLVRGKESGVVAGKWNSSGKNVPESNLWNGALLWRTAERYPDQPDADAWRERAHALLVNSVSVEADAEDPTLLAGRPVREWTVGPQFFDHYALDHHGYHNVGYQVICLSNAAMLHFDLRAAGHPAPESLYHHQADLWAVVRRTVFGNGRLARLGGDSRVRYAYCQEYLLPSLVLAADQFGDPHAAGLIAGQLELIRAEAEDHSDGSFYSGRLMALAESSPYYYTRLESDRACALGQLVAYSRDCRWPEPAGESFEESVAGGWAEPEYGAILHRSPTRLASFSWRAYGLAQGFCQPPDDGHLAEWHQNLAGGVTFLGGEKRELVASEVRELPGGFLAWGTVREGVGVTLAEGWRGAWSGLHRLAVVALPDDRTVVGLQLCRTAPHRTYLTAVKGLHLNLPNDLFQGYVRRYQTDRGEYLLPSPAADDELVDLRSRWVCLDGRVGVVGVYGAESLVLSRSPEPRGGAYQSLLVDELCWPGEVGTRAVDPSTVVLDAGWVVLSSADAAATRAVAEAVRAESDGDLRTVTAPGADGRVYRVTANLGDEPAGWLAAGEVAVSAASES